MSVPDADRGMFCPDCGTRLLAQATKPYPKCPNCGFVRYRNPVAGVAVVVRDERGFVLMGQRATGETKGLWCIPCGYVEWGEEIRAAGIREFEEETGLVVETHEVVAVHSNFHNPKLLTVGTWFRGTVVGGELRPVDGEFTALEYRDPAIPPPLAFPTDALVLAQLAAVVTRAGGGAESTPQ